MRFFHCTTLEAARAIAREGFRDPDPEHPRTQFAGRIGVWLSSVPKTSKMNVAQGDELIVVDLDIEEAELADYIEAETDMEWDDLEWCVPADVLNSQARARHVTDQDEADLIREVALELPPGFLRANRERGVSATDYSEECQHRGDWRKPRGSD